MTDYVTVFPPGWRFEDANANAISGGTVEFYAAGTTTPRTVYSDAALATAIGTSLTTDSGGYPTSGGNKCIVYTTATALKLILKDASGATIATHDNWQLASFAGSGGSGSSLQHVLTKTGDFTVQSTEANYLYNCDPTGGTFQATLLSSITAADGFVTTIRHDGTANQVKIVPSLGQTIKLPGGSTTTGFALTGKGHSVSLVADGAGYLVTYETPPLISGDVATFKVVSRVTAAPTSPLPGYRYIINGTPTGTFLTAGYALGDVVEADGQGGWNKYTPPTDCGWVAYVQGENLITQFRDSAWVDLTNVAAPNSSTLRRMIVRDERTSGTAAPSITTATWTTRTLQTTSINTILTANGASADASLATNTVTLPTGNYLIIAQMPTVTANTTTGGSRGRIRNTTTSTSFYGVAENTSINVAGIALTYQNIVIAPIVIAAATENLVFETYTNATSVGGQNTNLASINEVFAEVTILDLSSLQGPQGVAGIQGPTGPGYAATSTTSLAVGTGSKTVTTQTGLAYVAGMRVRVAKDSSNYFEGPVTSYSGSSLVVNADRSVGSGTYTAWTIGAAGDVGPAGTNGTNGTNGSNGSAGGTGASGPVAIDYTWDTGTTVADPGSGKLRANNASLASATTLYISETDRLGTGLAAFIQSWDDSTSPSVKGILEIIDLTTPANRAFFTITGTIADNGSYDSIPVIYKSGATSFSAVNVGLMFSPAGDKGADGAGSFTSLSPGAGITTTVAAAAPGSAITTSGTVSTTTTVNAQAGTTYTVVDGDRAKLVTFSNASAIAVTLPQAAATTAFVAGWFAYVINLGAGTVTITPTTSTINGAATLVLNTGQGCRIVSDGTNYQINSRPPLASITGVVKATAGVAAAAVAGTDYLAPPSGTAILKAASGAALANATAGTDYMHPGTTSLITKGFTVTPNNIGTVSSGTNTPDPTLGNYQYMTNNGAHTLAVPASDCAIDILVTNGASAGTITFAGGYTVSASTGDALTTTNTNKFIISIRRINAISTYLIKALQ